MPSTLPNSFASAAAGQSRGTRSGMEGGNGSGGGDWRDGRAPNTRTFRRPATTASNNQSQQQSDVAAHGLPQDSPYLSNALSSLSDGSMRYSKEQMLAISRSLEYEPQHRSGIDSLFSAMKSSQTNGSHSRGWGKNDALSVQDPETCLNHAGHSPMGYQDMTEAEKEMFADVNSPLKQQLQKEPVQGGANGRKTSISQGNNYPLSSPSTSSRPSTRRRETTDTNPFAGGGALVSPTSTGRFRDESWLQRKASEARDTIHGEPEEDAPPSASIRPAGFGGLLRSNTAGGTGFAAPSSPWNTTTGPTATTPGSFGSFAMPSSATDKRFAPARGESRFAHLLSKDNVDNTAPKGVESTGPDTAGSWRSRQRPDIDSYAGEDQSPASQVLAGEESLQQRAGSRHAPSFETPVKGPADDFGMAALGLGSHDQVTMGGTPETNPYRSPTGDQGEIDQRQTVADKLQGTAFGSDQFSGMPPFSRGFPSTLDAGDRSQTSSVGAKGFASVNPLGTWPSNFMANTPDRERPSYGNAFGASLFSGDLQSPGAFGGMPGVFGSGGVGMPGTGSIKGSKMNALFPTSMHAKAQTPEQDALGDSVPDHRHANPLGAIGRGSLGLSTRDLDSAARPARPSVEDLFSDARSPTLFSNVEQGVQAFQAAQPHGDVGQTQTKSMVMPDRMRWHYLDPQGEMQGPFTGLEMNDWYKANFFTPDLRVKKLEDEEFEPLGQLIRRIGNSREPFLVPQMGVPHGEPSPSGPFATGDRGVIPPLMNAFPSFGRTLTADEQNNLERRKQEEQFMQARHRELQLAHGYPKLQMPVSGSQVPLHHHSSAQSLHSQPSFGSITSPLTTQGPIGVLGQTSGFFDQTSRLAQAPRPQAGEDFMSDDLNLQEREMLASLQQQQAPVTTTSSLFHGAIAAPVNDLPTRGNLPAVSELKQDTQGFSERLKEFKELRAQREADSMNDLAGHLEETREETGGVGLGSQAQAAVEQAADLEDEMILAAEQSRALSLTQQVQNTQAAAEAAKLQAVQEAWETAGAAADPSMPMPFPPPLEQVNAPLPAPTAQRTRSTLPDQYATSRSQSETPESSATGSAVQPPPLAPWAREPGVESQKGPSLKEIQEAEAKKAAKAEEVAAAARRAAAEQEAAAQRERERAGLAVAPGLPTSSTWGNGTPVGTTPASSAWAKPNPVKAGASGASADKKRTLAEIQREEEKQKQKQTLKRPTQQAGTVSTGGMGTRYADLASKAQTLGKPSLAAANSPTAGPSSIAPPPGSGWNVVGAGGKPRVGSTPTPPAAVRSASAAGIKPVPQAAARPVVKQSASMSKSDSGSAAMEEIKKWLARELSRSVTHGVDVNNTVSLIMDMSLDDPSGITDVVYSVTQTLNARHLVEELVRRRKLADKGIIEKQPGASASTDSKGNGWNEVAKKGGNPTPKEESSSMPAGFKVVPGRKKGKK